MQLRCPPKEVEWEGFSNWPPARGKLHLVVEMSLL